MSGNGKGPAQGPKRESKESTFGATKKRDPKKVRNDIMDMVSGFAHATPENINDTRMIDSMRLHQVLKQLILKNNESVRSAAKSCGVPLSTFNSYLKPKKQMDPGHLLAIARHYSVSIDYLFGNQQSLKLDKLPTKRLFSKWVKVTIEDLEDVIAFNEASNEEAEE